MSIKRPACGCVIYSAVVSGCVQVKMLPSVTSLFYELNQIQIQVSSFESTALVLRRSTDPVHPHRTHPAL